MATSTAIFTYASLDSDQADSFRLLSLLPGLDNSPIECALRHTRRSAPFQPYEALSYAWGDPNLTGEILVNGLPFSITRNLEHALRSLRQDGVARTLWVDAICIDQSQVLERNHQVAQMHQIYAEAERVIIWLGDSSDDSDMAIAFMWEVCESLAARGEFSEDAIRSGQYLEKDFRDGIGEFLGPESDDGWEAVARLLSRDWWERAWVIQELVVAKDAICYCGKTSLAWSVVCANIDAIGSGGLMTIARSSHHFSKSEALDRAWGVSYLRKKFIKEGHISLWILLHRNRRQYCMDPRDKVYSILGMTNQRIRGTLQPDYTKSVSQVFTMAIVTDIKHFEDLEVLNLVEHSSITPNQLLPSWVADVQNVVKTWRFTKYAPKSQPYISAELNPITFSDDLHILHTDGLFLDVVEDTCVQQTDAELGPLPPVDDDKWTWKIENMTARLANEGGISTSNQEGGFKTPEDLARSVERAIYDVMIAGQIPTPADWIQHDVRYPDEQPLKVEGGDFQQSHLSSKAASNEQAPPESLHSSFLKPTDWKTLLFHASNQTRGRNLILSKTRYLALASKATQPGDQIFVLFGLHELAILRPQDDGTFKFVGTAYVHGFMKGEALEGWRQGEFRQQRVSIR
jgi:hypothetical protein